VVILIETVVISGYPSLFREEVRGAEALSASGPVLAALVKLLENDYRAEIRTILETGNPDLDDSEVRERVDSVVAHCSHDAAVVRMRNWIAAEVRETARALGRPTLDPCPPAQPLVSGRAGGPRSQLATGVAPGAGGRRRAEPARPDGAVVRRITRSGEAA